MTSEEICIIDTYNNEEIEFISYSGKYPNLCNDMLIFKIKDIKL